MDTFIKILKWVGFGGAWAVLTTLGGLAIHQYKAGIIREQRITKLEERETKVEAVAAKSYENGVRFDQVFIDHGWYGRP